MNIPHFHWLQGFIICFVFIWDHCRKRDLWLQRKADLYQKLVFFFFERSDLVRLGVVVWYWGFIHSFATRLNFGISRSACRFVKLLWCDQALESFEGAYLLRALFLEIFLVFVWHLYFRSGYFVSDKGSYRVRGYFLAQ